MTNEDWQNLLREAERLHAAGQSRESILAYQRLLANKPNLPNSWYNLGWLQRQTRAFDDALASYQRALDHGVSSPEEVHVNRAAIYSDYLHLAEEAERELEAALDKKPNYLPALLNLGNLHEDLGNREAAQRAYERVLAIDPANTLALARLATTTRDLKLEEPLRAAIAQPNATPVQQAGLGFALATILDSASRHDEAFIAVEAANRASRAAGGAPAMYDRAAQERFVDRLIGAFARPASEADPGSAPVFICGLFRSGSTLVEQILAGHSKVTAGGELDLIPTIVAGIAGYPEAVRAGGESAVERWREFYLRGLPAQPEPGRIVTDKRPDNFLHIGFIKTLFPAAKIVHTLRNPLDNLLSLYFLHLDPVGMSYALDLEDAAHWYGQYRRLMGHWKSVYGDDIIDVNYDAMVEDPQKTVGALLDFLGLEWEESCLDFNRTKRMVRTASVWQVRESLYKRSSGRWRNYEGQLAPLRGALAEFIA